jgi:hypothetical protein
MIELVALVVLSYYRHFNYNVFTAIYKCNDNNSFLCMHFTGIVLHTMPRGQRFHGVYAPASK